MWNKTVTLYNKFEDQNGQISWYRHCLKNCFVKRTVKKANVGGTQTAKFDYIIRIPKQSNYLPAFDWVKIAESLKGEYITLQGGDLIVLGDISEEINEYANGERSSDFIAKYQALGSVFVNSININTDLPGPHYLIRGE